MAGLVELRRLAHLLVLAYLAIAVVYPLYCLAMIPMRTVLPWSNSPQTTLASVVEHRTEKSYTRPPRDAIYWPTLSSDRETFVMSEDFFLSKAFSQSMRPCTIVPYYYRASGIFDQDDITITTLITANRLKVFAKLVKNYQGPISVAIHVKPSDSHAVLDALHDLYTSTPVMSVSVDVHLVLSPFDRQLNTLRNVARFFARTDLVMMLDVDFAVCTDFRGDIRASLDSDVGRLLKDGHAALVVPAFEYVTQQDGVDQNVFPKDKKNLLELIRAKRIDMFHRSWVPGHNSSDYPRFYAAPQGEVYKVKHYQSAYEPYVIFRKEGPPWCDERFVGYGGNKAACLYEMFLSGMSFYVLADHFLVHQSHPYEEAARKIERKTNRKIYQEFREEACLRYLQWHLDSGTLNTTLGRNVQEECKKIKGISKAVVHIIEGKL